MDEDNRVDHAAEALRDVQPPAPYTLAGPALAGHARCPNTPASVRRGLSPLTQCVGGAPGGCGATVTVADIDRERDRQRLPWQSTAFAIAGHNAIALHKWSTTRDLPEPWQVGLGEKPDTRPRTRKWPRPGNPVETNIRTAKRFQEEALSLWGFRQVPDQHIWASRQRARLTSIARPGTP